VLEIREAGYDRTVIGPDAFAKQSFIDAMGEADNVLVASPFLFELASLETRQFAAEYRAAAGTEPTQWGAFCCDAALLLSHAVAEKGTSREAIREYLAGLNRPQRALRGITGRLQFGEHGNIRRPILFSRIRKGRFQPAFIQLRPVTSRHVLDNVDAEAQAGHVQICDNDPYYLTRIVYTGLDFYRINYVDISGQNFDAEFFLWFRWKGDVELVESIDFLNGIYTEEDLKEIVREDRTGPVNYVCYKVKRRFLTPYDLRNFPFDTQRLPMTLSHRNLDADRVLLVVDSENLSSSTLEEIYPEEWTYIGREDYAGTHVLNSTFGDPRYVGEASEVEFSIFQTNVVIRRILFPIMVKLFLPMAIMITVSVLVLLIPTQQFDARIGLVMTALLSLIVFHLSQGESLPSVGYLVKADQYFMVSYVLMFTLILNTITVNILVRRESLTLARKLDCWFAAIVIPIAVVTLFVLTVTAWI
jgi:branched-chain amino acid transport system substrate-binding protein